jgi:hypothetical protein
MSRRAPSRPRLRTLVRASQRSRLEQQSLQRAYELALPVVTHAIAPTVSMPNGSASKSRRRAS